MTAQFEIWTLLTPWQYKQYGKTILGYFGISGKWRKFGVRHGERVFCCGSVVLSYSTGNEKRCPTLHHAK